MDAMQANPYHGRGMIAKIMPIPPIEENCVEIPAGPVVFVVESRLLTGAIISEHGRQNDAELGEGLVDDGGLSLHVCGARDRLEYLRFDCFENQPHYHYIRQKEQEHEILLIDDVAVEPTKWTMDCVRNRLPEMLEHAHAHDIANQVRDNGPTVAQGLERVFAVIERSEAAR